jgi:hypothetical protein
LGEFWSKDVTKNLAWLVVAAICFPIEARAAASKDVEQMTFFAIKMGRAVACRIDASVEASRKIGLWFDRKFSRGTAEQGQYIQAFSAAILLAAKRQQSGESVEPCSDVAKYFDSDEFRRALGR